MATLIDRKARMEAAARLVATGKTYAEAAAEAGVPLSTLEKVGARQQWRTAPRELALRRARALVERHGYSLDRAARSARVPVSTVQKRSCAEGWVSAREETVASARQLIDEGQSPREVSVLRGIPMSVIDPQPTATRAQAHRLARDGRPLREVAVEVGVPLSTIQKWSARDGWGSARTRPPARDAHTYARARELAKDGRSLREVAEAVAAPLSTVEKWSARDGWRARPA